MTYEKWITKQIKKGWKPPELTEKQLLIKASEAFKAFLSGK